MLIQQLSPNAYSCTDIIEDPALLYKTEELLNSFRPDEIRLCTNPDATARREVRRVTEYVYKQQLLATVKYNVEHLLPTEAIQAGLEVWRDYPGYQQGLHRDQAPVNTVFVAYFGTSVDHSSNDMGTVWIDGGKEYSIPYKANTGLLLKNSNNILHGMQGTVNNIDYRRAVYINWILT